MQRDIFRKSIYIYIYILLEISTLRSLASARAENTKGKLGGRRKNRAQFSTLGRKKPKKENTDGGRRRGIAKQRGGEREREIEENEGERLNGKADNAIRRTSRRVRN